MAYDRDGVLAGDQWDDDAEDRRQTPTPDPADRNTTPDPAFDRAGQTPPVAPVTPPPSSGPDYNQGYYRDDGGWQQYDASHQKAGATAAPAPVAPPPSQSQAVPVPSFQMPQQQQMIDPMTEQSKTLFKYLMDKAQKTADVDPNDPVIRKQSDTFNANLTRTGRQYLSQLAERKGSGGNIGAESRMIAEKNAQVGAQHEGELFQHDLDSRRQEIMDALNGARQFMTAQQQMSLQEELAKIDNATKMYGMQLQESQFGRSLDSNESQFGRTLSQDLQKFNRGLASSEGIAGADRGSRDKQFADSLAQRSYEFDTDDEFRRSPFADRG